MPAAQSTSEAAGQSTVVALFEDAIDAEHALLALRKADQAPNQVSLLVRSRQDDRNAGDRAVDVARDLVAAALGAVANWLTGLAELIVSERGRYLVAGPMGAALTGLGRTPAGTEADTTGSIVLATDLNADSLQWVLTEFGLAAKEAEYVEHRLTAGATLVAMSSGDAAELETARRVFGDHDAVYIGVAATDSGVLESTAALLAAGLELSSIGEVAVVDAVAPLRPLGDDDGPRELATLRGRPVVGDGGIEAGQVERVLVEDTGAAGPAGNQTAGAVTPRYLVIAFGGMLGLGRRMVALPVELADLAADPVTIRLDKETLHRAPAYDEDVPLSRSVEERLFRYFAVTPYWTATAAGPAAAAGRGDQDAGDRERDRGGRGNPESSPGPAL